MRLTNVLGLVAVGAAVTVLGAGCNSAPPQPTPSEKTGTAAAEQLSASGSIYGGLLNWTTKQFDTCDLPPTLFTKECGDNALGYEVSVPPGFKCPTIYEWTYTWTPDSSTPTATPPTPEPAYSAGSAQDN